MDMTKKNRLFVPLSTEPYFWFKSGEKKWELRKYGRQYTEKNIQKGRIVELRKGYSDANEAIWGKIVDIVVANNIDEFFQQVPFFEVIPISTDIINAKEISKRILKLQNSHDYKLIGFKVNLNNLDHELSKTNILRVKIVDHLLLADEYLDLILSGAKTTTIRRNFIAFDKNIIPVRTKDRILEIRIKFIDYTKTYGMLNKNDAFLDGFDSEESLKAALKHFYKGISDDTPMTIVHFNYEGPK